MNHVLVCDKDLETGQDLREWYATILFPVRHRCLAVDENDEVVRASFVDDLGLRSVSARHVVKSWGGRRSWSNEAHS
jgi:hypothetical protein